MHHPTDRIIHTTAFVTPVVEHWLERKIFTDEDRSQTDCTSAEPTDWNTKDIGLVSYKDILFTCLTN